jgi:choline dehydrogenase-like flavoprotein
MPADFRMQSRYGVGRDWPISYEELDSFYNTVEQVMAVSGPDDNSVLFPRSMPYPQPPHRFAEPDRVLKAAHPQHYFQQPTARARLSSAGRGVCCSSGVCTICPANAKFTVWNGLDAPYADPRVTLALGAEARQVETAGSSATGVTYRQDDSSVTARADLVVLAANAIFNPFLLLRSGFTHPLLGKRLHEQVGLVVLVDLDGIDNYQGSTVIVGQSYHLYDGPHRAERAACLIESINVPQVDELRMEPGRWRQRMKLKCIFEDVPDERNAVTISSENPDLPETVYVGHSDYTQRAIEALPALLPDLLAPLPVERIHPLPEHVGWTEGHIQGTTLMGSDPASSIVDRHLVHHQVRNLLVLGASVFPTSPPANPTLTLSALSLWAAHHLR